MSTPWNQQQQAYPPPPPPPPQGGSGRGLGKLLIGVALGVVITLVVAAVLLLTKAMSFGSTAQAATVDTTPISLPATLGTAIDRDDASDAKAKSADAAKNSAERRAVASRTYARTTAEYTAAYGGAAVAVRNYADSDLQFLPTVIAVRAPSDGLLTGVDPDPKDLGMAAPRQQLQKFGDVQCIVVNVQTVVAGGKVDPQNQVTSSCRRTDAALTIDVVGPGNGTAGQQQMISLTKAAFEAVSNSQP
ncbi:MAG: hypothetical protein ACR2P2_15680 [Nakamurella sp.]